VVISDNIARNARDKVDRNAMKELWMKTQTETQT
jgi:hypothetical protein